MEHYTEVGTADSVAAFRSFPDAPPPGRYCGLNKNTSFCSTSHQTTAVVNRERPQDRDTVNVLLTVIVTCVDNTFCNTPNSNKSYWSYVSKYVTMCLSCGLPYAVRSDTLVRSYESNTA